MDIALIWLLILGFGVLMYVILDGFSLGLGILYPWVRDTQNRELMMQSIVHAWDGNQTWLVFGGAVLFAAFPAAYSLVLSNLYLPLIVMLIALVFRGVAFEYRFKADTSAAWWDRSFWLGSSIAAFCQGLVLGALVEGLEAPAEGLSPGAFLWLSPFSLFTAVAVMAGYALLACGWLVMKTEGALQRRAASLGRRLLVAVVVLMAVVSVWMLLGHPQVAERWLSWPNLLLLSPLPVLSALVAWTVFRDLGRVELVYSQRPFYLSILLFVLNFAGLVVGIFPYIVPERLTLEEALAPAASLNFLLPGVLLLVPVILAYTIYGYNTFRGKVRPGGGGY